MKTGRMLVTGFNGLLGKEILDRFREEWEILATDLKDCDVTNSREFRKVLRGFQPQLVIHCAAYTAVDRAEVEEGTAFDVNVAGTKNVARECREQGALLVTYGTDYIFDGTSRRPYSEDEKANPLSAYGRSKWEAEKALREEGPEHLLIRSQWLYGPHGRNFVFSILNKVKMGESLRVVSDQTGCPTYAWDLADATCRLLEAGARGTYNFSNEGETTWHGFASFIIEHACAGKASLSPASSSELSYPAHRPAYSVLDKKKYREITGHVPRGWKDAVLDFLNNAYRERP